MTRFGGRVTEMLRNINELTGYKVAARDEKFGQIDDVLFDDVEWRVRYAVVDTRKWLPGRKAIVPPSDFEKPDWRKEEFRVDLTKEKIEKSPPIEIDKPVSMQKENEVAGYFGWTPYRAGEVVARPVPRPINIGTEQVEESPGDNETVPSLTTGDPHLRSSDEVTGYRVQARDGDIGHIEDLILDDDNWLIRYAVIDTRNWLPGKKVLIAVPWISAIDWESSRVVVDMKRSEIEDSPEWDDSKEIDREFEETLYAHYERPRYWQPDSG